MLEQSNIGTYTKATKSNAHIFIGIIFAVFLGILLIIFLGISRISTSNNKIASGIYIKNVNVSGLERKDAINVVNMALKGYMDDSLVLVHNDYITEISLEQLESSFDVESAVNAAYLYGRSGNIFKDSYDILRIMISNISLDPVLKIKEEDLKEKIRGISSQLPDTVIQSSYYLDGNNLIITKGKKGYIVDEEKMYNKLMSEIQTLNFEGKVYDIDVLQKEPEEIDIKKIHEGIYKAPVNASYTLDPYSFNAGEDGIDFEMDVEEVEKLFKQEEAEYEEFVVPLKITSPEITTSMLPTEAFPDLLAHFETRYSVSQVARTTNLKLAAEKINGLVMMPGETFSYNAIVGKRTIEAGYKEAPIYQGGKVVDGLGGGICQVSTTLYNAALYANLDIVERRNHQFVPSYIGAGLDATVVYGAIDFKFKNTRSYPIKIECFVENGVCDFKIFGFKREEVEYDIVLEPNILSRTRTAIKSKTYRKRVLNGEVVEEELLSSDTYNVH